MSPVLALKTHTGALLLSRIARISCIKHLLALGGEMLSQKSQFALRFFSKQLKMVAKSLVLGVGAPILMPPFAPGSRRLRRPRAAPKIWRADGFAVADGILGWSCRHCGGEGGRARRGPSPPHPGAGLVRDGAGSDCTAWEGAGGGTQTLKLPLLFPTSAFALGACHMPPKPIWGGISPIFIVTLYIARRRLGGQLPPSLPHPGGETKSR